MATPFFCLEKSANKRIHRRSKTPVHAVYLELEGIHGLRKDLVLELGEAWDLTSLP